VAKLRELLSVSLVVADYQLPDGTGYDLLEYCQSHLTDVPFIILAYSHDREKGFGAARPFQKGVFDYVHKPIIDFDEFIERIKHSIRIAHALA
jgi:CheY-like chemotaxis protein